GDDLESQARHLRLDPLGEWIVAGVDDDQHAQPRLGCQGFAAEAGQGDRQEGGGQRGAADGHSAENTLADYPRESLSQNINFLLPRESLSPCRRTALPESAADSARRRAARLGGPRRDDAPPSGARRRRPS